MVMTKCDFCGKKIGLFSVMYTWLDKKEDLAIHDRCLKKEFHQSIANKVSGDWWSQKQQ
jgi:hypothetical protein